MSNKTKSQTKANDLLGDDTASANQPAGSIETAAERETRLHRESLPPEFKPRKVTIGRIVEFTITGNMEGETFVYPAMITQVKNEVNASLVVFRENFTEFHRNVPQSEKNQIGFFNFQS